MRLRVLLRFKKGDIVRYEGQRGTITKCLTKGTYQVYIYETGRTIHATRHELKDGSEVTTVRRILRKYRT